MCVAIGGKPTGHQPGWRGQMEANCSSWQARHLGWGWEASWTSVLQQVTAGTLQIKYIKLPGYLAAAKRISSFLCPTHLQLFLDFRLEQELISVFLCHDWFSLDSLWPGSWRKTTHYHLPQHPEYSFSPSKVIQKIVHWLSEAMSAGGHCVLTFVACQLKWFQNLKTYNPQKD